MTISKPSADRLMKGQLIELLHFMKLNRLVEERRSAETLAVARHPVQLGLHEVPDLVDVDPTVGGRERTVLEGRDGADVHVAHAVLDAEERVVEGREPLEVGVRHCS